MSLVQDQMHIWFGVTRGVLPALEAAVFTFQGNYFLFAFFSLLEL